jgi:hypothetical protein
MGDVYFKNLSISRFGNLSESSSRLGEVILQELLKNSTNNPLLNLPAESSMSAKELVISFKICSFSKRSSMITAQRQNFSSDNPPETSYVEEFSIKNDM